jgi:exodeoxyribonuclease-3
MDRITSRAKALLDLEEPLVLAGDFNVIPAAIDARDPAAWERDALFLPQSRASFRKLLNLGFSDALRAMTHEGGLYTFWDYQAGAWQKNNGIRIDHCLLSPQIADRLNGVRIDKHVRAWEKPSDHVPVVVKLAA